MSSVPLTSSVEMRIASKLVQLHMRGDRSSAVVLIQAIFDQALRTNRETALRALAHAVASQQPDDISAMPFPPPLVPEDCPLTIVDGRVVVVPPGIDMEVHALSVRYSDCANGNCPTCKLAGDLANLNVADAADEVARNEAARLEVEHIHGDWRRVMADTEKHLRALALMSQANADNREREAAAVRVWEEEAREQASRGSIEARRCDRLAALEILGERTRASESAHEPEIFTRPDTYEGQALVRSDSPDVDIEGAERA
ncbi:hypothetical protein C8R43DRAFT_1143597 [Mycena crocata]|nr:hypothetical protein C8R43DRAFT_1143597 [Mycena crocata]